MTEKAIYGQTLINAWLKDKIRRATKIQKVA